MSEESLSVRLMHLQAASAVYLRSSELARRWSTTPGALAQLRYRGVGPEFVRIPGVGIRYRLDDIEAYERSGEAI